MAARIPWSSGTPAGSVPVASTVAAPGGERGERVAADERPAAPALAVLDRLEQEAGLVADERGAKAATGRGEVGQHLAPHGDDGVLAGQGPELLPGWGGASPEGPVEAGALAGVAGALALLLDDEEQGVAVAVVEGLAHELAVAATCRPCATPPGGCATRTRCAPPRGSCRSVSAFIHAIISTVAGALLLHDGRHQAGVVVLHEGELVVGGGDGGGDGHRLIVRGPAARAPTGCASLGAQHVATRIDAARCDGHAASSGGDEQRHRADEHQRPHRDRGHVVERAWCRRPTATACGRARTPSGTPKVRPDQGQHASPARARGRGSASG